MFIDSELFVDFPETFEARATDIMSISSVKEKG